MFTAVLPKERTPLQRCSRLPSARARPNKPEAGGISTFFLVFGLIATPIHKNCPMEKCGIADVFSMGMRVNRELRTKSPSNVSVQAFYREKRPDTDIMSSFGPRSAGSDNSPSFSPLSLRNPGTAQSRSGELRQVHPGFEEEFAAYMVEIGKYRL